MAKGSVKLLNVHDADVEIPYMQIGEEKIYFSTQNEVFLNSQCLFIEYDDIIKSPAFNFAYRIMQFPENFSDNYDIEKLKGFDAEGIVEWFLMRKNKNPIMELLRSDRREKIPPKVMDEYLNEQYKLYPILVKEAPWLNVAKMVDQLIGEKLGIVKKIVIWYPYENEVIKEDLRKKYGGKVLFLTGSLRECLAEIPQDSTYIFSEITNVQILLEEDRLKHVSVMIPEDYKYNFDKEGRSKIDYEEYLDEDLFKLAFFNATQLVEEKQ